jgi:hypothetical protein
MYLNANFVSNVSTPHAGAAPGICRNQLVESRNLFDDPLTSPAGGVHVGEARTPTNWSWEKSAGPERFRYVSPSFDPGRPKEIGGR